MNKYKWFNIILLVFMSMNANAALVTIGPDNLYVSQDDVFSVNVIGLNFTGGDLDGGGVNLTFDSSVLQVANVSVNTADWEFYSSPGTVDNIAGSVEGIVFNSFQSRNGDFIFATIEFLAVGFGTSAIGLTEYYINPFASGGSLYSDLVFSSGSVTVTSVPVPSTIWLFCSGIFGLAVISKKT